MRWPGGPTWWDRAGEAEPTAERDRRALLWVWTLHAAFWAFVLFLSLAGARAHSPSFSLRRPHPYSLFFTRSLHPTIFVFFLPPFPCPTPTKPPPRSTLDKVWPGFWARRPPIGRSVFTTRPHGAIQRSMYCREISKSRIEKPYTGYCFGKPEYIYSWQQVRSKGRCSL